MQGQFQQNVFPRGTSPPQDEEEVDEKEVDEQEEDNDNNSNIEEEEKGGKRFLGSDFRIFFILKPF